MVKLKPSIIDQLASMICGDSPYNGDFPYHSSSNLTAFFRGLDLDYRHDGSTRKWWVIGVLDELNKKPDLNEDFPSAELKKVIESLLDITNFISSDTNHDLAINQVNQLLKSQSLTIEKNGKTGNVTLCKIIDGFISTSSDVKDVKKVITFSPSLFSVPDKPTVDNCVSVMMPFSMKFDDVLETIKTACSGVDMSCYRADNLWNNTTIIQDIFEL